MRPCGVWIARWLGRAVGGMTMEDVRGSRSGNQAYTRQLQTIGFTEYESRSLIALMENSPATAYEVAKLAGLPRANAYSALESLTAKGAIQPVSENPARYVPLEPKIFLGRIAQGTSEVCDSLIQSLSSLKAPYTAEYVWSVNDPDKVRGKIEEMISSAKRHIWIKSDARHLIPHRDALRAAAKRGTSIVIILFGDVESKQAFEFGRSSKVYLHEGTGTHVAASEHLVSVTTDFKAALTASMRKGGYGVYTQNRPVVVLVESLIRHEIYIAEIFSEFRDLLESKYGPSLLALRRRYLPTEQVKSLEATIRHQAAPAADAGPKRGRARRH